MHGITVFSSSREGEPTRLRIVRDVVEIVAITLAGIWAIYVFVYENRIKPMVAPPDVVFSAQMERAGTHDGFAVVRVLTHVKNVGTVPAQFLGYSWTILGSRFEPRAQTPRKSPQEQVLQPFYSFSKPVVVYRDAFLTRAADPSLKSDLRLGPGESADEDTVAYAPLAKFDHLSLKIVALYVKNVNGPIPVTLSYDANGIPQFAVNAAAAERPEVYGVNTEAAALDLSGR